MPEVTLDYALPSRNRRRITIALVVSAIAVGTVGKLCWDKFAGPVRTHFDLLQSQRRLEQRSGQSITLNARKGTLLVTDQAFARSALDYHTAMSDGRALMDYYHGPIQCGGRERVLCLEISPTWLQPTSTVTLVARVYTKASLLSGARAPQNAQYLTLGTFKTSFDFDMPELSATNRSILVVSGARDGTPVRYEISIDGRDNVTLVEDAAAAATLPASNSR